VPGLTINTTNHEMRQVMKLNRYIIRTIIFCNTINVYAGDEDLNPTAYQRFDPETGFMVTIDSPPSSQHTPPSQQNTTQPSAQMTATATAPEKTNTTGTVVSQAVKNQQTDMTPIESSPMWMYLVAGALILGGFAAWVRNKEKVSKSNLD
jgi:cobalamin biosynthesis Mg chelatase CobN